VTYASPGRASQEVHLRGDRYLFVQAAWVVLIRAQSWERYGLKPEHQTIR
jgi:hypothetical protein